MNKLSFDHPYLANKGSSEGNLKGIGERYSVEDIMLTSYFSSELGTQDPIESAIRKEAEEKVEILGNRNSKSQYKIPGYNVDSFTPFNPTTKYTEAKVTDLETGKQFRCVKGAPHIIVELCGGHKEGHEAVIDLANRGLRALGVARTNDLEMEKFELIGMVSLLDPPRIDSGETIRECQKLGVEVKMITGDQAIIGREVARRLGMGRCILDAPKLVDPTLDAEELTARVIKADGFAQVIPEHKFKVVELLQHAGIMVAMTGDGVNDAPALKKANVGIAVEGCTDAARSASDIVLLAPGLSTIVDAIKISREIFQRMRSYALYRITSTIHFLLFFFFSILIFDFTLPSRLILSIAVLNDAAAIVIAVDNARPNIKPDKWRLGQLIFLSFILGFFLCLASYGHFLVGKFVFELDPAVLQTVMYLQISSNPHFIIFSTRLVDPFWFSAPSPMFLFVILLTQVIGLFMSVYGFEQLEATAMYVSISYNLVAGRGVLQFLEHLF
jgi:H+-transporting ATPase